MHSTVLMYVFIAEAHYEVVRILIGHAANLHLIKLHRIYIFIWIYLYNIIIKTNINCCIYGNEKRVSGRALKPH